MTPKDLVLSLWRDIGGQNWDNLARYFSKNAVINWHNTNECFDADEFIAANRTYPGNWAVEIQRLTEAADTVTTVVRVSREDSDVSFHTTSFFVFAGDKIVSLDEYWGDDGDPPQWRLDMGIGRPIR